jgi:hypothetical protein
VKKRKITRFAEHKEEEKLELRFHDFACSPKEPHCYASDCALKLCDCTDCHCMDGQECLYFCSSNSCRCHDTEGWVD